MENCWVKLKISIRTSRAIYWTIHHNKLFTLNYIKSITYYWKLNFAFCRVSIVKIFKFWLRLIQMIPLHQLTRSALRVTLHSLVLWNTSSSSSELPMKETMMMEATVLKRIATNPAEKLKSYKLLLLNSCSHTWYDLQGFLDSPQLQLELELVRFRS